MLSGLLSSPEAIRVNIEIMRTFVSLRKLTNTNKEFSDTLNQMELKYDYQFKVVFDALRELIAQADPGKNVSFSCNCVLNFMYLDLEKKKTGVFMVPATFISV